PDLLGCVPRLAWAMEHLETVNRWLEQVDPIECIFDWVPERYLAENIIGLHYTFDRDHRALAQWPPTKNSLSRFFCSLPVTVSGRSVSFTNFMSRGILYAARALRQCARRSTSSTVSSCRRTITAAMTSSRCGSGTPTT